MCWFVASRGLMERMIWHVELLELIWPEEPMPSTLELCSPHDCSIFTPISWIIERPRSFCRWISGLYPHSFPCRDQLFLLSLLPAPSPSQGATAEVSILTNQHYRIPFGFWDKQGCLCTWNEPAAGSGRFYIHIREKEWNHISFL